MAPRPTQYWVRNTQRQSIDEIQIRLNPSLEVQGRGLYNFWTKQHRAFCPRKKNYKQAGAELCQAQVKLGLEIEIVYPILQN